MKRKQRQNTQRARGFSIIELLVAIIIIGILATILIPIVANRSEQARRARAESDLERIGDALERAAIDIVYYPRLFMLDDTIGADNGPFVRSAASIPDFVDSVRQYRSVGYYSNINQLFVDPATGDLVTSGNGQNLRLRLVTNETEFNWNGPYINWQDDENVYTGDTDALPDGIPDDPWGNNYLLFTREGLILEPDGTLETGNVALPPNTSGAVSTDVTVFDRMTVVSLGPNGLPGDSDSSFQVGQGDDMVRQIGR